jgi:hypothetical protein
MNPEPGWHPLRILVTMVGVGDDLKRVDTIEYKRGLWLVPSWIEHSTEGYRSPARIIRIDLLQHQPAPEGYRANLVLNAPIPKPVFDGAAHTLEGVEYEVAERPDIRYPLSADPPLPPSSLH